MGIKTAYIPAAEIHQQPQRWKDSALGVISFGVDESANQVSSVLEIATNQIPTIHMQSPILDGAEFASEIWLSHPAVSQNKPLKNATRGAIHHRVNEELLFGVMTVPESGSLQHATESAYLEIFSLMSALDFPHIYRFWNYMADINGMNTSDGLERYRQFNVGRKDAFLAYENGIGDQLPAACALGLADGPLTIAFLLGREAPIAIQNPRQINAYEYPDAYGPRTPSFSRATLLNTQQEAILFISGTASIVGHLTQHPADVLAQTQETLFNLDAVIAEANRITGQRTFNLQQCYFRVYIRHAADLSIVRDAIEQYIGGAVNALFVQADICRQELLLEIEATAGPMLALVKSV